MAPPDTADTASERQAFNEDIKSLGVTPLWEQYHGVLTPEPQVKGIPHIWKWDGIRKKILRAGDLITAKEAERRVLMLENPAYAGEAKATETLFTGIQMILPGEVAPAHRHTPNALRLILEGSGGYTSVNGEKTFMEYGDYIITPNWCWHDHGNEGDEPVIWQDILDLPLVRSIGAIFHDPYPEDQFPAGPPEGDSLVRYGSNMVPAEGLAPDRMASPIFSYPYARSREAMEKLAKTTDLDPYHGLKMEFIDPTTGGAAMSSISTFLQRLPKTFKGERYQTTEGCIFTCLEGGGRAVVDTGGTETTIEFRPKDVFCVPCWYPYRLEADEDTYLFQGTDKVVQTKLGLWREKRGNA